jgi:spoIIIJ-associated protein
MMEDLSQVEATGETVGEAKWAALRELEKLHPGLDKGAVRFQVVSEGERGLLGVGYAPARVVALVDEEVAQASTDGDSELAADVRDLLERITVGIGVRCRIDILEDDETVTASCSGSNLGLLIGKHGQTIDAVQFLVNASLHRRGLKGVEAVIDAQGYRKRRERTLTEVALRAAEEVRRTGQPYALEPMTSTERKIVHTKVQELGGLATASEGLEPNRHVVVLPAADDEV